MTIIAFLESFTYPAIFIRLLIATISGALIGLERGVHGKNAGVRTFSLVCLGSALVMVTNEFLISVYSDGDPARLGAQVISGVGFLGVGTIIVTGKNHVKGLTTAATLWTTACIGIAFGSGFIVGGLMAVLLILFIMTVLTYVSRETDKYISRIQLYMEISSEEVIDNLYYFVNNQGYSIISMDKQSKQTLHTGDIAITVKIDLKKRIRHELVIESVRSLRGVHYIEEMN